MKAWRTSVELAGVTVLAVSLWLTSAGVQGQEGVGGAAPIITAIDGASGTIIRRLGIASATALRVFVVGSNSAISTTLTSGTVNLDSLVAISSGTISIGNVPSTTQAGPFSVLFSGTQNVLAYPTGVTSTTQTAPFSVVFSGTQNVLAYPTGTYAMLISGTQAVTTATPRTPQAPAFETIGTASTSVLASNTARRGGLFVNTSVNTISCAVGQAAVLNRGVTLQAGAALSLNEYSLFTGAMSCIASLTNSNLSWLEFQ